MTAGAFCAAHRFRALRARAAGRRLAVCTVLLATLLAGAAMPALAQSCGPSVAGSPCAAGQTAGMDSTGGVGQAAGNPINLITGNKHQRETDMPALPGVLGLELVRHYNSRLAGPGMPLQGIGRGWQFSYDTRLHAQGDTLQIIQADGARIVFARSAWNRTLCTTSDPAQGRVRIGQSDGRPEYRWLWPNGRELGFDHHGRLVRIGDSSGMAVVIERMPDGRISSVTDPQGRSMRFHYLHRKDDRPGRYRGVQSVDTPVGRFLYDYGDTADASTDGVQPDHAVLRAVHVPGHYDPLQPRPAFRLGDTPTTSSVSTLKRIYHHEDQRFPTLLTGITVDGAGSDGKPMRERIATWAYDGNGLAVRSIRHAPENDGEGGRPEEDGAGEQLTFERSVAGQTRVTDGQGRVTTYRHAIVAGAFRLLEARGAGCDSCGAVNVRYRYDRHGRVEEVIALDRDGMPVAGRRQQLDALGRPYAIQQVSYRRGGQPPVVALVLRQQFPYPALTASAASAGAGASPTHFGPKRIARDSVVPGKTHEVRIAYNGRWQVLQLAETGYDPVSGSAETRITRYRYEEIDGRSLLVEVDGPLPNGPAGTPADSDITRYQWDERGAHVTRILLPMGATLDLAHDAHTGRPRSVRYRWDDIVRVSRYTYGSNGQVTRHRETAYAGDGTTVLAERDTGLASNARNEISSIAWPDNHIETLTRRWPGREAASGAPPLDAFLPAADQPDLLRHDFNGKSAERLIDDFGQVVGIRNPGQGWQTARYDAAGRISEIRDARGMVTTASHDAAGRLLHVTRKLPDDAVPERLDFTWRGPYRQGETVTTAGKRTHTATYVHTPWGQVSQMRVVIGADDAQGGPVNMALHSSYDAAGRLSARTLPGGERLAYRYYASSPYRGQRAAIEQLHWPRWLDWLMARVPEHWLDKSGVKTRLADFAPQDDAGKAGAGAAASFAQAGREPQAPAAEPGMAGNDPGQQHDVAGLPQRIDTASGHFALRWNAASQLVSVRRVDADSGGIASYTYDAHGRRASKRSAAGAEYYLYEGTQLLAVESRPHHGPRSIGQYLYEGYRPVALLRDGIALLLQTDHRGAVSAVTSAGLDASARKTLWRGDPGPWGKTPAADAAASRYDPRLRLVNQYADEETGLSYNVARYYDPASGRFISPDPAGIADTLDRDVPDALRLDLTAYAAGQPSRYFDPDGAARLIYYALTTGKDGKQLGTAQGFTKARWAFSVDGIEASGDGGSDAVNRLMEKYAKNQTGLLYDRDGNFIEGKKSAISWNGASDETVDQFIRHYGANMTRLSQFTINGYSNRDAALLIAAFTGNADEAALCPNRNSLLPPIRFAPEEKPLLPTDTSLLQRILNCGVIDLKSTTKEALRERMLIKLNQAISLNETRKIYNDCSQAGCPSIAAIFITEPGKPIQRLPAAYSHLQFAPETLTEILLDNLMNQPLANVRYEISQERLDKIFNEDSTRAEISDASTRARWVYVYGYCMAGQRNGYTDKKMFCPDKSITSASWDDLPDVEKKTFTQRTGLNSAYWTFLRARATKTLINKTDYVNNTTYKEQLDAVAWAAWKTIATADTWFTNIAEDNSPGGRMEALAIAYFQIRKYQLVNVGTYALHYTDQKLYPLANGKGANEQSQMDLEIAMRIARRHNGGYWWYSLSRLKSSPNDENNYVKKIVGDPGFEGSGNYPALRCAKKNELPKNSLILMPLDLT